MLCYNPRVKAENAKPNEEKRSFNWGWVVWPVVVLGIYILSSGPMLLMTEDQNRWRTPPQILSGPYAPVGWAYRKTPLRKPLGLYLHLWLPSRFNRNGEPEFHNVDIMVR